ncbi:MAG: hypothetical protein ACK5ZO_18380 [Gemmatimonas sp.]|jgi:hypothetical protein|uniref:hypothetical protein n=1 Tax=Gemmatimonas sp. TaxID=1962908 RepID=UPI00391FA204
MVASLLSAALLLMPPAPQPAPQPLCVDAAAFLTTDRTMAVVVEADTLDDWRTRQRLTGCRITAAGGTVRGVQPEAVAFYERVRAVGWVRTPDPYDAPSEASLRFRMGKADCLFNLYGDAMLMTDAEDRVDLARVLAPGEKRYHVYVMCLPVMPAAPRER